MDEHNIPRKRKPRKRTRVEIFKEEKLPLIIAAAAGVLILIFIIGSISNAVKREKIKQDLATASSQQSQKEKNALDKQVSTLLQNAQEAALGYDYDSALEILEPVARHVASYPELKSALESYQAAKQTLVCWNDPAKIPNLSFQMLIADSALAFNDSDYGSSFNRNYITISEFSKILEQLYKNGYVLVSLSDIYTSQASEDGAAAYMANAIYLPEGKKPVVITQTNVNYDQYLIDSNKDGDLKDGRGFAKNLIIKDNKPINQMIDRNGNTLEGDYDLIPILESFIASHPDFSYKNARAVIALTGHEGLFGFRTNNKDSSTYYEDMNQAAATAQWLQNNGYELACYTYGNKAYGNIGITEIRSDLQKWSGEVTAILGDTKILVFAQRSDINAGGSYAGGQFEILQEAGFRFYLGFCEDGNPWSKATTQYVRQGRIMVAGATLAHNKSWFSGMFDADSVLDASRVDVPSW